MVLPVTAKLTRLTGADVASVLPLLITVTPPANVAFTLSVPDILSCAPPEFAVVGAPRLTVPAATVMPPPGKLRVDVVLVMVVVPLMKSKAAGFAPLLTVIAAPKVIVLLTTFIVAVLYTPPEPEMMVLL